MTDMEKAFDDLSEAGMNPTWVGGDYIIANVTGIRLLPGKKTEAYTETEIVRSLASALWLVGICE